MAAIAMSTVVMAQETQERKRMTKEEAIKMRTEQMVKTYGLDEAQSAKLLELNTAFADKMPARGMRPRGQRPDMKGEKPEGAPEQPKTDKGEKPQRPDFGAMKKIMEEYDAQLQTILNEDQYKAYKSDREKFRQRGPRNRKNK